MSPVVEAEGGCIGDRLGDSLTITSEGEIFATSGARLHDHVLGVLSRGPDRASHLRHILDPAPRRRGGSILRTCAFHATTERSP